MSVVSDECDRAFAGKIKGRVFDVLRKRGPISPADPDLSAWLDAHFGLPTGPNATDDRWLADQIIAFGAEPRWALNPLMERQRRGAISGRQWAREPGGIEAFLSVPGTTFPLLRTLYFPGTTQRRAMVISGVHGNEQGGVEVVETLIPQMQRVSQDFCVMVVPRVFAKNYKATRRKTPDIKDPNRQMPAVGKTPSSTDSTKKPVEQENQALLDLIQRFQPERLISVHGHGPTANPAQSGGASITVDPRKEFDKEDKKLALQMATVAKTAGANLPGNFMGTPKQTVIYPTETASHEFGVTLGAWGCAAAGARPAICMMLIETDGYPRSDQPGGFSAAQRDALVAVTLNMFLDQAYPQP